MFTLKTVALGLCLVTSAVSVADTTPFTAEQIHAGMQLLNSKQNELNEAFKTSNERLTLVHTNQDKLSTHVEAALKNTSKRGWPLSAHLAVLTLAAVVAWDHADDIEKQIKEVIIFFEQVIHSIQEQRAHQETVQASLPDTHITLVEVRELTPFDEASQRTD